MESLPMKGQVALVTGAAQGIGRATALAFAREGAAVVISDLATEETTGQQVADEVRSLGGQALFTVCDVTREADIKAMIDLTVATFGRLDMACNNAGHQRHLSLHWKAFHASSLAVEQAVFGCLTSGVVTGR